jgi:hypothetical protein
MGRFPANAKGNLAANPADWRKGDARAAGAIRKRRTLNVQRRIQQRDSTVIDPPLQKSAVTDRGYSSARSSKVQCKTLE